MTRQRLLTGLLLGSLALSLTLALSHAGSRPLDRAARQKLDALLAQGEPQVVPDPGQVTPPALPVQPDVRSLFELMHAPEMDIQETPQAYEIRVPLDKPADAQNVTVDAEPHRIAVTVKSVRGGFSSSAMRATTTVAELLPARVKRETLTGPDGKLTLLITVPKREAGGYLPPVVPATPNLSPGIFEDQPEKPVTI